MVLVPLSEYKWSAWRWKTVALVAGGLLMVPALSAAAGFRVPSGFEVTEFAGDDLAHDIFTLTIDPRGDVVVAGPGYVKILLDEDGDGMADRAHRFSDLPRTGAHGLCFDGNDLLLTGDRAVLRLRDADGDRVADGPPEVIRPAMNSGEHGAHQIKKGPDGWFYLVCGNSPEPETYAGLSPVSQVIGPRQGTLTRFSSNLQTWEVLADGFRNPYDFDFAADGLLFTYEADGERVHYLPGYGPCRVYDIAPGEHHGWMLNGSRRSWSKPLSYPDRVDSVIDIGRGSPTGVLVYRHRQFPARYRSGVFVACWSTGTVYFVPLTTRGSTYDGALESFLSPTGHAGFAPVALAVGPSGDLFVAIGGRGTRGGVFRVRYTGGYPTAPVSGTALDRVLAADHPLSAWSRALWVPQARELGAAAFVSAAAEEKRQPAQRVRAIEVLVELFGGVEPALAARLANDKDAAVVTRLAWALSRGPVTEPARVLLGRLTGHEDVRVQRASWESILTLPPTRTVEAEWKRGLGSPDRRVRAAAVSAARRHGVALSASKKDAPRLRLAVARLNLDESAVRTALDIFQSTNDSALKIEAVRLLQLGLGDLQLEGVKDECATGYVARDLARVAPSVRETIAATIVSQFPTGDPEVDREAARLLGMLQVARPEILPAIASFWTQDSSPVDDLHYLFSAIQAPGPRPPDFTRLSARAMARLHEKMEDRQWLPDRQWPLRVVEVFRSLNQSDPAFVKALVDDPAFGRASHSLYVAEMSGPVRKIAARKMLQVAEAQTGTSDGWTGELIEVVGASLPATELLPRLRARFNEPRVHDSIALVLAAHAEPADRARLIDVLETSLQGPVVDKAAQALAKLSPGGRHELAVAIKALGRHRGVSTVASSLNRLLSSWTGHHLDGKTAQELFTAWAAWLTETHPEEAARLAEVGGVEGKAWMQRLAKINWEKGDGQRGATVYQQRACAACHDGSRRLGPSLAGITARFSREDLFLHIVDPNLSISPTYLAQEITLKDGTVHLGVPVYQSAAAVLLETGLGGTVRLSGDQIQSSAPARQSPMPEGLLNGASDAELADLYAYLQTLTLPK